MTDKKTYAVLALICVLISVPFAPLAGQQTDGWSVSLEPIVKIGVVEGNPAYMFASVRTARLLPDDRIVVADRGKSSIRVYDSNGAFQVEMGGEGEGPGEFQSISGMWVVPPDTIRVWDSGLQRITTFRADGSLLNTQKVNANPPQGPGGVLDAVAGAFSDGDVALGWTVGQRLQSAEVAADRTVFGRFGPNGQLKHLLGEGEGLHRYLGSPVPFSPYPRATVFRDSLFFMNGVGGRIAVFDPKGDGVVRTIEIPARPVDASEAWSALRAELRAQGKESVLQRVPDPRLKHTPALSGMLVDDRGFLWAKAYDPTSDSVYLPGAPLWGPGGEWWVITPQGETVTKLVMPENLVPLHIRGTRLVGLTRGPLDVERIVVHTIDRP